MEITWDDAKRIIAEQAIRIYADEKRIAELVEANHNLYKKIVELQEGTIHA